MDITKCITFIVFILLSCNLAAQENVVITGKLKPPQPGIIKISHPKGHVSSSAFEKKIKANKALKQDIKRVTNMKGIPWYMIKQKDGTLSKDFIYRPGFKTKLYKQLKKYTNNSSGLS